MRILISNDDGVNATGIHTLAEELKKIADVTVIAPDRNRSAASNSLTMQVPIRVQKLANNYYSVSGTPTDCVHLALRGYFEQKFDMVVSGINHGSNLGDDVIYSGTVAAATEGRILGMPAIAVSLSGEKGPVVHFKTAARVAWQLVEKLQKDPLPAATILNVNVPDVPLTELRGFEVTRCGSRHVSEEIVKMLDPRGMPIFWVGTEGPEEDAGPGTDFHAIKSQKVSITPLKIDMTNYTVFDKLAGWVRGLE